MMQTRPSCMIEHPEQAQYASKILLTSVSLSRQHLSTQPSALKKLYLDSDSYLTSHWNLIRGGIRIHEPGRHVIKSVLHSFSISLLTDPAVISRSAQL